MSHARVSVGFSVETDKVMRMVSKEGCLEVEEDCLVWRGVASWMTVGHPQNAG